MNTDLKTTYSKRLMLWMVLGYGLCMLALIGMLAAQMVLGSNVIYAQSIWMNVLDIAITLVDILAFAFAAVTVIYGIYLFSFKDITNLLGAYLLLTVLHYVGIVCIGWGLFGLPESVNDLFKTFWEDILLFVLLDCLRMYLLVLATMKAMSKHERKRALHNRAASMVGNELQGSRQDIFPLRGFISFKNPVQVGAFVAAVIYWLTFILQYVYIDILALIKFGRIDEFFMQFIYVILNAILATVCYCIINYLLMRMDEKMPKKDA